MEDRIQRLQEKKRSLFGAALNEKGARGITKLTREELLGLFRPQSRAKPGSSALELLDQALL